MRKRIKVKHPLLDELRKFAKPLESKYSSSFRPGLGIVGLTIHWPLVANYYDWCTPLNSWVFGSTGGDGHHFGLLERNSCIALDSPVVLTTPDNCGNSVIVGANLHEFLCLGCREGYFNVCRLANQESNSDRGAIQPEWWPTTHWQNESIDSDKEPRELLAALREKFELTPWQIPGRFAELQKMYENELILPKEVTGE